jgi:NDP-sugar pyrophosphorylase family protein
MVTLVVLAGGRGTRFGGLKQLAPVGPRGEVILDYLLERAAHAGYRDAVVVVAPTIEDIIAAHLQRRLRPSLPAAFAVQACVDGYDRPIGTAHALLCARDAVDGPFVVLNADDLYPAEAFALATGPLSAVGFRVANTLVSDRAVSRALLDVNDDGVLLAIREGQVQRGRFESSGTSVTLSGRELVSMNMWGLRPSIFEVLDSAVRAFVETGSSGEVLLPDVIAALVESGETVTVRACEGRCIGITHAEDVTAVRDMLA